VTDDFDEQGNEPRKRNWLGSGGNGPRTPEEQRAMRKRIVALAIAIVVVLFAVLNFGRVKVNWIVTTGHAPLIVVIIVSVALGFAADRLLIERNKRRRSSET
jgi:uncharacterized integral membrane protein